MPCFPYLMGEGLSVHTCKADVAAKKQEAQFDFACVVVWLS